MLVLKGRGAANLNSPLREPGQQRMIAIELLHVFKPSPSKTIPLLTLPVQRMCLLNAINHLIQLLLVLLLPQVTTAVQMHS